MSNWLKDYIEKILLKNNIDNITINVIYHPTEVNCKEFSLTKYNKNKEKSIVQIGFWMRKMNTIYNINTNKNIKKIWLPGGKDWKSTFEKYMKKRV